MKRAALIADDLHQIGTIADLTSVFEGIASLEIGRLREQVLSSKKFFHELWNIYSQLRISEDSLLSDGHTHQNPKKLLVAITAQGGLSGDIDSRLVESLMREYDVNTCDVVVVGSHGQMLLAQRKVKPVRYFDLPKGRDGFGLTLTEPLVEMVGEYSQTIAFYPSYLSLSQQNPARIELIAAVRTFDEDDWDEEAEIISELEYDFEPNFGEMVDYLEHTMLGLVISEIILEAKLAQPASRFNAMASAKQRALEMKGELRLAFNRSKRAAAAERNREIIAVLKG